MLLPRQAHCQPAGHSPPPIVQIIGMTCASDCDPPEATAPPLLDTPPALFEPPVPIAPPELAPAEPLAPPALCEPPLPDEPPVPVAPPVDSVDPSSAFVAVSLPEEHAVIPNVPSKKARKILLSMALP